MNNPTQENTQINGPSEGAQQEREAWAEPTIETMSGAEVALLGTEANPCAGQGTLNQNSSGPFDPCANT